jgi:tetratricopeptide (TPR) repeat protein
MDLGEKIKKYFKEAELYKSHGLLAEALEKYKSVEGLVKSSRSIRNREGILKQIASKIESTDKMIQKLDGKKPTPEVAEDAQSLMKEMFSFDDPEAKGSSALGGAIALAKFGQYDKAIEELSRLIEYDSLRLEAAKNILWCWIQQNYSEYAVSLYQKWLKNKIFPPEEASIIQNYFNELMDKAGIDHEIEEIESQRTIEPDSEIDDEDILDISAAKFVLPRGPKEGEKIELEISFQSGKYIRMIIPRNEKDLIDSINPGDLLKEIVFYSPVAIFSGEGYVSSKNAIDAGPKKGDFSLEIKIIKIFS